MRGFLRSSETLLSLAPKITTVGRENCDITIQVILIKSLYSIWTQHAEPYCLTAFRPNAVWSLSELIDLLWRFVVTKCRPPTRFDWVLWRGGMLCATRFELCTGYIHQWHPHSERCCAFGPIWSDSFWIWWNHIPVWVRWCEYKLS